MVSRLSLETPPMVASMLRGGPVALFLDFDGTLVEIAPGPDKITPLSDLNERLARLSAKLEGRCAIVSGRAISDIEKHIGTLPLAAAGSHGSDIRGAKGNALGKGPATVPDAIEAQMCRFASENSIEFERKPHGAALHYRSNPGLEALAHDFADKLASDHGWVVQGGKCVVEVVAGQANKGTAVETLMGLAPFAGSRPLFIGDDLTDEAGFAACQALGGAGVLVGDRSGTSARYCLPDVPAVHQWLEL